METVVINVMPLTELGWAWGTQDTAGDSGLVFCRDEPGRREARAVKIYRSTEICRLLLIGERGLSVQWGVSESRVTEVTELSVCSLQLSTRGFQFSRLHSPSLVSAWAERGQLWWQQISIKTQYSAQPPITQGHQGTLRD